MAEPEEISLLTEIQRLALADPFEPFILVMTSGERYSIGKMDEVSVGRSVVSVMLHRQGERLLRQNQISEISIPLETR